MKNTNEASSPAVQFPTLGAILYSDSACQQSRLSGSIGLCKLCNLRVEHMIQAIDYNASKLVNVKKWESWKWRLN